ncbi:hypothetical protein B0H13DRAFT_1867095 [Mycena leptocephala]|nr:hypothetical protein B0H13DRAFT_1867095 [Mycena leptocephala]
MTCLIRFWLKRGKEPSPSSRSPLKTRRMVLLPVLNKLEPGEPTDIPQKVPDSLSSSAILSNIGWLLAEIDTQRTEVAALRATLAIEHNRGLEQRIRLLEERGELP